MTVTRWWWVRHAPTHKKTFVGASDVPADLSDTAQIARLNAALPQTAVLISSDLSRAAATADVLAAGRTRLSHDARLREFDFGEWEGRHWSEVSESHPDLSRAFWENPGAIKAPGGESWDDVATRVAHAVADISAQHQGHDIIAVAHFGVILTQVQRARAISPYQALAQSVDNLSITELVLNGGEWSCASVNWRP